MKYKQAKDGEWLMPQKNGYRMMCCDCGLVHRVQFEHVPHARGRRIIFRAWRDERATSAARRKYKQAKDGGGG